MSLLETTDRYIGISGWLDELTSLSGPPAGWRGLIYSVIDHLRNSSAFDEQIDIAERISVTLLQLDWAIQRGDSEKQEKARQQLSTLSDSWHSAFALRSLDDVLELQEVEIIKEALEH